MHYLRNTQNVKIFLDSFHQYFDFFFSTMDGIATTPTPIPTPESIPELGGGPGTSQMSVMGMMLLGIFVLLGFAWWRAWQLYQEK